MDNAKAMTQQIQLNDLYQTVQTFMGGSLINFFNRFGLQWQVYVQADGDFRTQAENLGKFYVRNASGDMVPLSTLTTTYPRSGPEFVMRYNLFNCVQINASAAPGYSSAQVMAALEDVFHKTMPSQMGFDYSGMSYQEQKAAQGVSPAVIFGMAFFVVFLIMAAQYESWTLPFSVLLGLPIAVFGAFLTLYLRRFDNNVYAQIGLVMLIGLSSKNAILIVEFAKLEYDKRQVAHRRDPDRRQGETAAHPDDRICLHSGLRAVVAGIRSRRYFAPGAGNDGHRRHARVHRSSLSSLFRFRLMLWSASATSSVKRKKSPRAATPSLTADAPKRRAHMTARDPHKKLIGRGRWCAHCAVARSGQTTNVLRWMFPDSTVAVAPNLPQQPVGESLGETQWAASIRTILCRR